MRTGNRRQNDSRHPSVPFLHCAGVTGNHVMHRQSVMQSHEYSDLFDDSRVTSPESRKLPPSERIADRLCDVLLGADEILGFLDDPRAAPLRWMEHDVRHVFNEVDRLMRKLTD